MAKSKKLVLWTKFVEAKKRALENLVYIKLRMLKHATHHRVQWAISIGAVSFALGWFLHSEGFKHFAEIWILPALEAIISKQVGD